MNTAGSGHGNESLEDLGGGVAVGVVSGTVHVIVVVCRGSRADRVQNKKMISKPSLTFLYIVFLCGK